MAVPDSGSLLDPNEQPTLIMHRPYVRHVDALCPICLMKSSEICGYKLDARYHPLGICAKHLDEVNRLAPDLMDVFAKVQYEAIWRWMHPYTSLEVE